MNVAQSDTVAGLIVEQFVEGGVSDKTVRALFRMAGAGDATLSLVSARFKGPRMEREEADRFVRGLMNCLATQQFENV